MSFDRGRGLLLRTAEERQRVLEPVDEQFKRPLLTVSVADGLIKSRLGGQTGLEIDGGEGPEVSRRRIEFEWPTRDQIESALAENKTQASISAALGVPLHRLREAFDRAGVEWPWSRGGRRRFPEQKEDKPAVPESPAAAEQEPDPAAAAMMQAEAEIRAEQEAAATGEVTSAQRYQGGLLIELPQTTLDRNSVDRLLSQLRDTITTASSVVGGEVELQLTARVGVTSRG